MVKVGKVQSHAACSVCVNRSNAQHQSRGESCWQRPPFMNISSSHHFRRLFFLPWETRSVFALLPNSPKEYVSQQRLMKSLWSTSRFPINFWWWKSYETSSFQYSQGRAQRGHWASPLHNVLSGSHIQPNLLLTDSRDSRAVHNPQPKLFNTLLWTGPKTWAYSKHINMYSAFRKNRHETPGEKKFPVLENEIFMKAISENCLQNIKRSKGKEIASFSFVTFQVSCTSN